MAQHDDDPAAQRTLYSPGPDAPTPGTACLVVIHGTGLGRRVDVYERPVLIGRGQDCSLRLQHPSVSRSHCEVVWSGQCYRLRDLGATNRTRVNNLAVEQAELKDGDLITVGESLLKFISHESPEAHYHEEVYQLATHDALTGLTNRRLFMEHFDNEIARSLRHAHALCLCILDVDHFKPINDRYGHPVGDTVLQKVAAVVRGHLRREDVAARIGGEEFAVLLPETGGAAALRVAEALREAVAAERFLLGGETRSVTVSIGLALLGPGQDNRSALLRAADQALYLAKERGRNRVCVSGLPAAD